MEFDDRAQAVPTDALVFTLPHHTLCIPLSCETFRGEPATRQFDWSFAPTPRSRDRFERQNRYVPPPAFPQASHCPGIAHCLSGLTTQTARVLACPVNSLARVSRRVQLVAFRARDFSLCRYSRCLPSQYLFAIGHRSYLALDAHNHPFILHYQTALLAPAGRSYGALTLSDASLQTPAELSLTTGLRLYHPGCSDFARRYCRNHRCFLFRPLLICLSPRGSRAAAPFEHRVNTAVLAPYRTPLRSSSSPVPIDPSRALRLHKSRSCY